MIEEYRVDVRDMWSSNTSRGSKTFKKFSDALEAKNELDKKLRDAHAVIIRVLIFETDVTHYHAVRDFK